MKKLRKLPVVLFLLAVFAVPALADDGTAATATTSAGSTVDVVVSIYEEIEWTWNDGGITASDSW
jgi:hypothetical protein